MTIPHPGGTARLGDRDVARIGYGAMQLAERPAGRPDRADAVAVVRRAVELGVNHIDTAQFYGNATANEVIREALRPGDDVALVSKVGAARSADDSLVPAQRPAELRATVEADLRTLGVDRLAVVNLRRVDDGAGLRASGEQIVDLDDQLAELVSLRDAGSIGGIGLSNVDADQLTHALPAGIVCVQNAFSLLDRHAEPVLSVCRANGIAWVPFFPLGSAFPGMPRVTDEPVVQRVAREKGVSPAQVGLAWLLAHHDDTLLIPGTTSVAHLEQNLAAGDVELDSAAMAALDAVAA